jgi:hypothetical protein
MDARAVKVARVDVAALVSLKEKVEQAVQEGVELQENKAHKEIKEIPATEG